MKRKRILAFILSAVMVLGDTAPSYAAEILDNTEQEESYTEDEISDNRVLPDEFREDFSDMPDPESKKEFTDQQEGTDTKKDLVQTDGAIPDLQKPKEEEEVPEEISPAYGESESLKSYLGSEVQDADDVRISLFDLNEWTGSFGAQISDQETANELYGLMVKNYAEEHETGDVYAVLEHPVEFQAAVEIVEDENGNMVFSIVQDESYKSAVCQIEDGFYAAFSAFYRDYPEVFWIAEARLAYTVSVTGMDEGYAGEISEVILKTTAYEDTEESLINRYQAAVDEIKDLIDQEAGNEASRADVVRCIYHYLGETLEYDEEAAKNEDTDAFLSAYTSSTAFLGRKTDGRKRVTCDGYAKAFKVLCDQWEVPCVLTEGNSMDSDGNRTVYMQNFVQTEDGEWYGVDAPWMTDFVSDSAENFLSDIPTEETAELNLTETAETIAEEKISRSLATDYKDGLLNIDYAKRYAYTGQTIDVAPYHVFDEGQELGRNRDYRVRYTDKNGNSVNYIRDVGTYYMVLEGLQNYEGTVRLAIQVTKEYDLNDMTVAAIAVQSYTGTEICPAVKITNSKTKAVLKAGTHYKVSYENNIDIGTATVIIDAVNGKGYTGRRELHFEIQQRKISDKVITVTGIQGSWKYTGEEICPVPVLKYGKTLLQQGIDYEVSYYSNVQAGTAEAVFTGLGNYSGSRRVNFQISPIALAASDIEFRFDGEAWQRPTVVVMQNGRELTANRDYTVTYAGSSILNIRTGNVTVKGKGNYSGTVSRTYQIPEIEMKEEYISFAETWYYTGGVIYAVPSQIVIGGRRLIRGTDYVVSYETTEGKPLIYVKDPGKYRLIIAGKGNYKGTVSLEFTVSTDYLLGRMTVIGPEPQVYMGRELTPEVTVENPYDFLNSHLEKDVDYTIEYEDNIEVGTGRIVLKAVEDSGYAGEQTVRFRIQRHPIDLEDIVVELPGNGRAVFDGKESRPEPQVFLEGQKLVKGQDYTLRYSNNRTVTENGKKAFVYITGIGNFEGSRQEAFQIVNQPFSPEVECRLEEERFVYNGQEIEPALTVVDRETGESLVLDEQYRVFYETNINAGTAKLILYGIESGGYSGRMEVPFDIEPRDINSVEIQADIRNGVQKTSDGAGTELEVVLMDGEKQLQEGVDYQRSAVMESEDGTLAVTLSGTGNYTGVRTETIARIALSELNTKVELAYWEGLYEGYPLRPDAFVWVGDHQLESGRDFTVSYQNNINTGTAEALIQGCGIYTGSCSREFKILPVDINTLSITKLSDRTYFQGKNIDTKIKHHRLTLEKGKDYTIDFTGSVVLGSNKVRIEGKGNYTGVYTTSIKVTFSSKDRVKVNSCSAVGYDRSKKTLTVQVSTGYNSALANSENPIYLVQLDSLGATMIGSAKGTTSASSSKSMQVCATFKLSSADAAVEGQNVHLDPQPYFRSAMMSKYALALPTGSGYQIISTNPLYIENPEITAVMNNTYTGYYEGKLSSKKGVQDADDVYTADLGAEHVLLNVYLDDMISTYARAGYEAYKYKGRTYYFQDMIALCNTIRSLNGWTDGYGNEPRNVTVVLLLRWRDDLAYLIHPAARVRGAAPYYTLNMQERTARETFEALFCYMGVKLGNNKQYRACNWTLGNEVNCCQAWNYSGGMSVQDCAKNYAEAFQLLYQGVRRTASTDRVFISLDHSWAAADHGHSGKEFLDYFAAYMNQTAPKMEWNVNYHPYSQPLSRNDFWNDYSNTTDSEWTSYISMRNIAVLTNYLSRLESQYGKKSGSIRVILGEQGFSGIRGSSSEYSQADALSRAYSIAKANARIDSFIIRAYLDDPAETAGGLYLGLRDRWHVAKRAYSVYKSLR